MTTPDIDTGRVNWPTPDDIAAAGGTVEYLRDELLWAVNNRIDYAPRSLQTRLGPSEIGHPCDRRLGHKVIGTDVINTGEPAWYPTIGTAVHSWLEGVMTWLNGHFGAGPDTKPRFLLEHKVDVGEIDGEHITGSCDVYDRLTEHVIDWKVVGERQLRKYAKEGPGSQYRTQAHLYGRGWTRRGLPVSGVAVMFLPRDRMLRDTYFWHEPYNEQIAIDALSRADGITKLARQLGPKALPMLKTFDAYCQFCPYFQPGSTDLQTACPGDPKATVASTSLSDLIAK